MLLLWISACTWQKAFQIQWWSICPKAGTRFKIMAYVDVKLDMYAERQEIKDILTRMLIITFMCFPYNKLLKWKCTCDLSICLMKGKIQSNYIPDEYLLLMQNLVLQYFTLKASFSNKQNILNQEKAVFSKAKKMIFSSIIH